MPKLGARSFGAVSRQKPPGSRHVVDQAGLPVAGIGGSRNLVPYIAIATIAGIVGGLVAPLWSPRVTARSAIQHFAAGLVIAAVASDLIPEVEKTGTPLGILGGFAAGGLAMIGLKWLVLEFEKKEKRGQRLPVGLAAAAGADTLIDGAIISAGFSSGEEGAS